MSLDAKQESPLSIASVEDVVVPILKQYRVQRAGLFGSVVNGMLGPESDIDLLVDMPAGASLLDLAGLSLDLEQALGRKVDILTYNSIYPRLRERILAEQVVLF
ncbi:MAG: nucleotidyltransferase family protein [Chloroflexota bacterium]|nr:nucleotidyltransferase family protein [Chloroflexota bacterium]MDE2930059.1 nucleotidyltransferase family protein [Chloroflexota bacterium]